MISEVASIVGGGTPDTKDQANFGGCIPWITPADLSHHASKLIDGGSRTLTDQGLASSGAKWLPKDAVLFSSRAPIGYTAIASRPVTTNQGFKSFVLEVGVRPDFVYWWLKSAKGLAEELASGTTFLEISGAKAALIPFPLAPEAEQSRIVDKLEELLSDLDAGVAELKAAQRKLALLRQSLLKAAVEGALTADWRAAQAQPTESGAALLQRILTERRARWEQKQRDKYAAQGKTPPKGWQSKYPEPVAPDTTGLPELPEGWVWASLDALIDDGPQNGVYLHARQYGRGTPILRIDDYQIGWHREREGLNLVEADASTCQTYRLCKGDIVVNRVNSMTHLGKCLDVTTELDGVLFESNMMRLRLHEGVRPDYVCFYLGSTGGRSRLIRDAKWAVNQASINQQDVRRTPVPLAGSEEQERIVDLLRLQHDSINHQLEAISTALRQSTAQRKNLLRAAFAGQLVPQDPNDEPASALLARIRAARAGSAAPQRRRVARAKEKA